MAQTAYVNLNHWELYKRGIKKNSEMKLVRQFNFIKTSLAVENIQHGNVSTERRDLEVYSINAGGLIFRSSGSN